MFGLWTGGSLAEPTLGGWRHCDLARFLSVKDVADELSTTETAVYTLLKTGEVPAIQVGPKRVWRIEREKLEEYIERQYAAARDAIAKGQVTPEGREEYLSRALRGRFATAAWCRRHRQQRRCPSRNL